MKKKTKPDEIKERFEKKITITLQSFNRIELVDVQQEIMNFIAGQRNVQEIKEKHEHVSINTMMEEK